MCFEVGACLYYLSRTHGHHQSLLKHNVNKFKGLLKTHEHKVKKEGGEKGRVTMRRMRWW